MTPDVKMLALSSISSPEVFVLPSVESVSDGTYAISRNLYMYTQNPPNGELKTYLDWIVSADAQKIVVALGFVPLGASETQK